MLVPRAELPFGLREWACRSKRLARFPAPHCGNSQDGGNEWDMEHGDYSACEKGEILHRDAPIGSLVTNYLFFPLCKCRLGN
jgi:hypothetical protein